MAVNTLIYPLDYPPTIVGLSDLELRVIELEDKMESVAILGLQDRRDGGNDAIDLELKDTSIGVYHSAIPRFGFREKNLGTKGFILGGETDGSLTGRIAKFDYLFETPSLIGADIGIARHSAAGTSAVAAGYLSGGNTATNITAKIEKLNFDSESVSLLAQQLQVALSELAGFATTADSFTFGGLAGTTNSIVAQIRALKHSTEAVTLLSAVLAMPKSNMAVVGTTTSGFIVGGKIGIGTTVYSQSIEKMTWVTQSVAPASFSLSAATAFNVGVGNDFSGYIVGGRSGGSNATTISRIAHTTGSISPVSVALTTPTSDATAVGSSRIGYLLAGGTDPSGEFRSLSSTGSIQRLTFVGAENPVERVEPMSFSLPYAAVGASGVSDYSPGTYSNNVVSIVNLYDGIYSKLPHVHDDRYPLKSDVYYRSESRQKLNADLDLYVDTLNTVPGTAPLGSIANPFATITRAIEYAKGFDFNSHRLRIKIANGIYEESLRFDSSEWTGLKSVGNNAAVILEGNAVASAVIIKTTVSTTEKCLRVEGNMDVWVKGVKFLSTKDQQSVTPYVSALWATNGGTIVYSNIVFGSGFTVHVGVDYGGQAIITGPVLVEANAAYHVVALRGGIWDPRIQDRLDLFPVEIPALAPNAFAAAAANIVFATGLTIESIFRAESGGVIHARHLYVTFIGSATVTGYACTLKPGGIAYTSRTTDRDTALEWSNVPGSLGYFNNSGVLMMNNSHGVIRGDREFYSPLTIPDGILPGHAINLSQLNDAQIGLSNYTPGSVILWDTGRGPIPPGWNFYKRVGGDHAPAYWGSAQNMFNSGQNYFTASRPAIILMNDTGTTQYVDYEVSCSMVAHETRNYLFSIAHVANGVASINGGNDFPDAGHRGASVTRAFNAGDRVDIYLHMYRYDNFQFYLAMDGVILGYPIVQKFGAVPYSIIKL
jgi:hypothetical protein